VITNGLFLGTTGSVGGIQRTGSEGQ